MIHDPAGLRDLLRAATPPEAARLVLGGVLTRGPVALRIVEVEAYGGLPDSPHPDPAAHTFRGPTPRNAVMFGDAGHLYVYLIHGLHHCVNVTYAPTGTGGGVLLRAAEVVAGDDAVSTRRPGIEGRYRARGPGNLGRCLGVDLTAGGTDLLTDDAPIRFRSDPVADTAIHAGPRVGVSVAVDVPWRFWIAGHPAVSAYRRSPRARPGPVPAGGPAGDEGQWRP